MRITVGQELELEQMIAQCGIVPTLAGFIRVIRDCQKRGLQIPLSVRYLNPTSYADDSDVAHIVAELQRLAVDIGRD